MRVLLRLLLICAFLLPATSFAAIDVVGIVLATEEPDPSEDDFDPLPDATVQVVCERRGQPYWQESISDGNGEIHQLKVPWGPCDIRVLMPDGVPSTVEAFYFEQADESFLILFLEWQGSEWSLSGYVE